MTKFILIGNYPKDNQESMNRFALMLQDGFRFGGFETEIIRPLVFFGFFFNNTNSGLGKWLGYLDKWLLFPIVLRLTVLIHNNQKYIYHICDHSNSFYLKQLPKNQSVITCHDVLAIRGALGYKDAFCNASRMGVMLQKWILKNLIEATKVACVSKFTLNQLTELSKNQNPLNQDWRVIHNSLNDNFIAFDVEISTNIFKSHGINMRKPFILHVGSNLPRKNRSILIEVLNIVKHEWGGNVIFAGQGMDDSLISLAKSYNIEDRILEIKKPSHTLLNALYCSCTAFIFPSFSEGFGWPIIEAQACGAPIIASNLEPLPEISGRMAMHVNPNNPFEFVEALKSILSNESGRNQLIEKGFQNVKHFTKENMINQYLKLYGLNNA